MTLFQSVFLGLVQGVTEFLPVSSSGHLVLLQKLFGISGPTLTFDILVHFGTLLAVLLVFREEIWAMIRRPFSRLTLTVVVGSMVSGLIGIAFKDSFEVLFASGKTLGIEFIATGLALLVAENWGHGRRTLEMVTFPDAAVVGLLQGLAILPAVSRSGLTITGALLRGLDRKAAAKFSFLLSAPIILGANLLELKDLISAPSPWAGDWVLLLAGTIAAAIAGYLAIRFMLSLIERSSLRGFAWYVIFLGVVIIGEQLVFHRLFPPLF